MSPEERQAALDNISPEDLQKIRKKTEKGVKVEIEDLLEAEFALKFGWQAYKDMKDDLVSSKTMMKLIVASRKLESLAHYNDARSTFIGAASANSKRPSQTFTKITKDLLKNARADK
jgi:hypothetical protein